MVWCGVAGAAKRRGAEGMKGWVDGMPNAHIYLLRGQVCCVIALHLARGNLRSFMKRKVWLQTLVLNEIDCVYFFLTILNKYE